MVTQNEELTKKVLNALDPKYILSQDQESKITSISGMFRDRQKHIQTIAQKAAIAGEKHLEKKGFFQKGVFDKEWRSKQPIFNPKGSTYKRGIYNRGRNLPVLDQKITSDDYRKLKRTKEGGNKTRKRSNTSANSRRK